MLGMVNVTSRYTEQDTETYYNSEDAIYRAVWDVEGSVHWGVFDESIGRDFLKACANLDRIMVLRGKIDRNSRVLDLGCGNGTTAIWLAESLGCRVTGVDLSEVRIGNAVKAQAGQSPELQDRLSFQKASATELPFDDGHFTHLWSQAVIYHVHDKGAALNEAYRVLQDGGIMVFDDLLRPRRDISADAQKYVYDRLLFDTEFSFESYQSALKAQGFEVLETRDISEHLKTSYVCLSERTPKSGGEHAERFQYLAKAYLETARAVENNELGWGLFVCQK
jgi:ubiquinone/menaquinone biosynthesis C-methylase UbiE